MVKYIREKGKTVPVIFYTNSDKDWISEEVYDLGGVFYCSKEAEFRNLIDKIKEVVG